MRLKLNGILNLGTNSSEWRKAVQKSPSRVDNDLTDDDDDDE